MDNTSSLQLGCMLSKLSDNLVAIHMHNVTHREISGNREEPLSPMKVAGRVTTAPPLTFDSLVKALLPAFSRGN